MKSKPSYLYYLPQNVVFPYDRSREHNTAHTKKGYKDIRSLSTIYDTFINDDRMLLSWSYKRRIWVENGAWTYS